MVAHAADTEGPKKRQAFESPKDLKEAADFRGSFSGYESNRFFLNGGGGKPFIEAGYPCGLAAQTDGRAVAAFDLEGDGYPDLAVLSLQGFKVYRNQLSSDSGHFVDVSLKDKFGGPALGARIRVDAGGRSVVDRSRLTMGFHTQVMNRAHFGLGDANTIESIRVHWPSGSVQTWARLKGNRHYRLEEGNERPIEIPIRTWKPAVMPVENSKLTVSSLQVRTLDGKLTSFASSGRPTVVNLWAPWCTPCAVEAPELDALYRKHSQWLNVVGLSVESEKLAENRTFIGAHKLSYPNFILPRESIPGLFGHGGKIQLPTTLIFDHRGQLVRRFSRAVRSTDLLKWIQNLRVQPSPEDYDRQTVLLEAEGDGFAGIKVLKQAADEALNEPLRYMSLARIAAQNGRGAVAVAAAEKTVALSPRSEEAWALLINMLSQFKDPQAALEAVMKAPDTPTLLVLKANMLLQLSRGDEALVLMKRAISLRPNNIVWKRQLDEYLDKKNRGFRPNHNRK